MLATDIEQLIPRIIAAAVFLLVGFPIHEYAHARTALHYGDGTAKLFGRVTLDPRSHFDPAGGMMLVISTLAAGLRSGGRSPPRSIPRCSAVATAPMPSCPWPALRRTSSWR